jgi:predicted metal-dependent enzyme (double-stranded beta helix superfamily)
MPLLDDFTARCRRAIAEGGGAEAIRTLVEQVLPVQAASPIQSETDTIVYRSNDLLIVSLAVPAFGNTPVHSHGGIWCVVGVAIGCEENALFERSGSGLVETRRIVLEAGATTVLAPDVIHKIRNPRATPCIGLHVYGADLLSTERQMWNPHTGEESPMQPVQFDAWCDELTAAAAAARGRAAPGW